MDGHSSHITANAIALCMRDAIDLLILPPHCSHVLQPLDVGVFAPLKRALTSETDATFAQTYIPPIQHVAYGLYQAKGGRH